MKQIKKICCANLELSLFDHDTLPEMAYKLIKMNDQLSRNLGVSDIHVEYVSFDDVQVLNVWGNRLETDEEAAQRIAMELHLAEKQTKREYELYLQLKQKFGDIEDIDDGK